MSEIIGQLEQMKLSRIAFAESRARGEAPKQAEFDEAEVAMAAMLQNLNNSYVSVEPMTREEIDARANALASRQSGLQESLGLLELILVTDEDPTNASRVYLGKDSVRDQHYARLIYYGQRQSEIGFEVELHDDTDGEPMELPGTVLVLRGANAPGSAIGLEITEGVATWVGSPSADTQPYANALITAEHYYDKADEVLKTVLDAVNDLDRNPELAARAALLREP